MLTKEQDEILENIAHQWRQPLSQINSTVSIIDKILYEKNIQDERLEEKLQEIERLTKYMSNTIDDFRQQNTKSKKSLQKIIEKSINTVQITLNDKNIELITDLEVNCESSYNENELKQVMIVLLNNAKDALLQRNTFHAKIKLSLEYIDKRFIISIYDNAGGITKSVQSKLFEPYYTTKHNSEGTGIGLYMAKKIIEDRYNGTLDVKNKDEGSCFFISLPEEKIDGR